MPRKKKEPAVTYVAHTASHGKKFYMKRIILGQANAGEGFIPPRGVVFKAPREHGLWVSQGPISGVSYFRAAPFGREGEARVAYVTSVERVMQIPDVCPPFHEWERAA